MQGGRHLLTRRRAAVLGSPVSHSLSPALHTAAYAELGLDWEYGSAEVDEAGLAAFLRGLGPEWVGLSLTMPLKRAAPALLDEVSPLAAAVGAVNTVTFPRDGGAAADRTGAAAVSSGGGAVSRGDNTDVPGMVAALRAAGVAHPGAACVLGAGATACSALAALAELGVAEPTVLARDPGRAGELRAAAGRLGVRPRVLAWSTPPPCDLLVATTPAGGTDALAAALPEGAAGTLFDVVYDPWPTPLARAWAARGGRVVGGLELLVHQAALQVELMTGRPAPLAAMRAAGERALAAR